MSSRAGVSQVLNRYTYSSTLSHLRRTNTQLEEMVRLPNQDNCTILIGLVPENPEGQACGLVKNLSLMTCISVGTPSEPILDFKRLWFGSIGRLCSIKCSRFN